MASGEFWFHLNFGPLRWKFEPIWSNWAWVNFIYIILILFTFARFGRVKYVLIKSYVSSSPKTSIYDESHCPSFRKDFNPLEDKMGPRDWENTNKWMEKKSTYWITLEGSMPTFAVKIAFGSRCLIRVANSFAAKPVKIEIRCATRVKIMK